MFSYLVNVEDVRPSIPSPISRCGRKLPPGKLDNLAWPILSEQSDHGARAWSPIQPYGKLCSWVARRKKPKECVGRVCAGYMHPTSVLLLRIENGLAGACWWAFVRDRDVSVDGGNDCR